MITCMFKKLTFRMEGARLPGDDVGQLRLLHDHKPYSSRGNGQLIQGQVSTAESLHSFSVHRNTIEA